MSKLWAVLSISLLLPLLGFSTSLPDQYLIVEALPGDGIYSILRRYELVDYSCNFTKFYELNNHKKNKGLVAGRKYKLPIKVKHFNGKSIRSSIGINDWDLAISIQGYNEKMLEEKIKKKSFKEDNILWVPHHLLACPDKKIEIAAPVSKEPELTGGVSGGKNREYPVFGPKYSKTPLKSNQLKGQVYYIVSGHGGPDPGAMSKRGNYRLCEDEYAYDVALRLCRNLIANGATAYMITRDPNDGIRDDKFLKCDSDEVLWGGVKMSRSQKTRLFQRSDIINDLYNKHRLQGVTVQRAIYIHVDSRNKGERTDLFFYHKKGSVEGKKLANNMHKVMKDKYKKYRAGGYYHGTVSTRDLHMLRESKPTGVYIELANIRNVFDQQRIVGQSNRQYLADWLFQGLTSK